MTDPGGLVDKIGAPPAQDLIGALGEHHPVSHCLDEAGEVVVINHLRVAESPGGLPEKAADPVAVPDHLIFELALGEQEGQGMVVGLVDELHAAGLRQGDKALQDVRPVHLQLVQQYARDRIGYPEIALNFLIRSSITVLAGR